MTLESAGFIFQIKSLEEGRSSSCQLKILFILEKVRLLSRGGDIFEHGNGNWHSSSAYLMDTWLLTYIGKIEKPLLIWLHTPHIHYSSLHLECLYAFQGAAKSAKNKPWLFKLELNSNKEVRVENCKITSKRGFRACDYWNKLHLRALRLTTESWWYLDEENYRQ